MSDGRQTVIGSKQRPILDRSVVSTARDLVLRLRGDGREVIFEGTSYWVYELGEGWRHRDEEEMVDLVWPELADMWFLENEAVKRLRPSEGFARSVVRALRSLCLWENSVPWWSGDVVLNPGNCIAFKDVILDVESGEVAPQSAKWVGRNVVPVVWEKKGKGGCPTWERLLGEWAPKGEEAEWAQLLQRQMGYVLLQRRDYARFFLDYGSARGGKGTKDKVLRMLVRPPAYLGTNLNDLAGSFGMDGMDVATVMVVSEANELESKEGEVVARIIKNALGQDATTINAKNQRQRRSVVADPVPILVANEMPKLPNKGRGLSSKLVPLLYPHSFVGKEDEGLIGQLRGELDGIVEWCVEGARELVRAGPGERWPLPKSSEGALGTFQVVGNLWQSFLEARFVRREGAFVSNERVRTMWRDFARENRVREHVSDNFVPLRIEEHNSWGVRRFRESPSQGGRRGLLGLTVKRTPDDGV